ncbi:MAG: hypothetical protein CSA07_04340 [Bacteroidia bacterium]|nr:MAG: hypothetical protein CSA07_04340 [Bacteroidia bacterium]
MRGLVAGARTGGRALLVLAVGLLCGPACLGGEGITVVSYNVENLFQPGVQENNPDTDYSPEGAKHFTYRRLDQKIALIGRALVVAGGWGKADIIGLCEVENRYVLERLLQKSVLGRAGYWVVHRDSPDRRGIDVAMLYRKDRLRLLGARWRRVMVDTAQQKYSRDLLLASFQTPKGNVLHIIQCHWPSKFGGEEASLPRREIAARETRHLADSLLSRDSTASIIAMGDFNEVVDNPIFGLLTGENGHSPGLRAAEQQRAEASGLASYKYGGISESIDHFFVSPGLLARRGDEGLRAKLPARVCAPDFLLEVDGKYGGLRPFRSYLGPQWHGGASDHLPIVLELAE